MTTSDSSSATTAATTSGLRWCHDLDAGYNVPLMVSTLHCNSNDQTRSKKEWGLPVADDDNKNDLDVSVTASPSPPHFRTRASCPT